MEIDLPPDNALQQQEPERHYEGNALLVSHFAVALGCTAYGAHQNGE